MNNKIFFSCLMITFGMLFWLVIQPGSLIFIGVRVAIAFVSIILVMLSVTWDDKKKWGKTLLIILVILLIGSLGYAAFNWGLVYYPLTTVILCVALVISILLYIKYIEPKILRKKVITDLDQNEFETDEEFTFNHMEFPQKN